MQLAQTLDLKRALKRVLHDKHDDTWPDIVGYRDYTLFEDENLAALKGKLERPGSYSAGLPLGIDLPKKGFTLRPGIVPLIDDRIVYQGVADFLAPSFSSEPCVYSNRLEGPGSSRMFVPGVQLWLEFQAEVEKNCGIYPYVVETDITAYFEHINHDLLMHRLDDWFGSKVDPQCIKEIKMLLPRLLKRWVKGSVRQGIPQVNDPSSFYANLYLDEFDKWMLRHGYMYLRYVDDMRVFAADEPSARRALAELVTQLRTIGLYVGSAKTAIRKTADVLRELSEGRQRMDAIEAELKIPTATRVQNATRLLEAFANDLIHTPENFNDRHFRYCVNRFKKFRVNGLGEDSHGRMAREVLRRLTSMPYSTDIFVDYLSLFTDDELVQSEVLDFLEGPYNIYPWQEMLLLELLLRLHITIDNLDRVTRLARSIALGPTKHPACKAKALILWGKNGDYADRREIRARYYDEEREDVRRAIMLAIQEMQPGERDNFYKSILDDSSAIRLTSQYLQGLRSATYHYYNPSPGFVPVEPSEDSDDIEDLGSEDFLY